MATLLFPSRQVRSKSEGNTSRAGFRYLFLCTRALRRRHCVNFGRRRRRGAKKNFKGSRKMSFYTQHFLMQQNKYTAKMASAARRQVISGGAPVNKSRQRPQRIVGGGGAPRPAQGFTLHRGLHELRATRTSGFDRIK